MRVRAIQLGYYGHKRRHEGDEFDLEPIKRVRKDKDGNSKEVTIMPEQQFSPKWMEKVGIAQNQSSTKREKKIAVQEQEPEGV